MDFSAFIGFLISVLAIVFLIYRKVQDERYRRAHPKEYEQKEHERQKQLKKLLKTLEIENEEEEEDEEEEQHLQQPIHRVPPPPPKQREEKHPKLHQIVSDEFRFQSKLDNYRQKTAIEQRQFKTSIEDRYVDLYGDRVGPIDLGQKQAAHAYEVIQTRKRSKVSNLINRLPSSKDMVILYEVFGPPKGLRNDHF